MHKTLHRIQGFLFWPDWDCFWVGVEWEFKECLWFQHGYYSPISQLRCQFVIKLSLRALIPKRDAAKPLAAVVEIVARGAVVKLFFNEGRLPRTKKVGKHWGYMARTDTPDKMSSKKIFEHLDFCKTHKTRGGGGGVFLF